MAEGAEDMIAHRCPGLVVDCRLGDVAEMAHGGHGHIGQGQANELALAGESAMTLRRQDSQSDLLSGDHIPGGKGIVDGFLAVPGEERQTHPAVHRVVECAAAVTIAYQVQIDQVFPAGTQFLFCQPTLGREVGGEDASVLTVCSHQASQNFTACGLAKVHGY